MPISVLPGLLQSDIPDSKYLAMKGRLRRRIAQDLSTRIEQYNGRLLVVIGARKPEDLETLYETLESSRLVDLRVLIVWPENTDPPPTPDAPVTVDVWRGSPLEFGRALEAAMVPAASDLPQWSVLVGRHSITLQARDVHRIAKRFALITERDLVPPDVLTIDDVRQFLEGDINSWKAYAFGLPVERSYRTELGNAGDEAGAALLSLNSDRLTRTVEIPSEPGAGVSTLIRRLAFRAARDGYPTVVLKSDQVDVDVDDVVAFAGSLAEASFGEGVKEAPPMVIVTDVEHEHITGFSSLLSALAQNGRRCLLIRATAANGVSEQKTGRYRVRLPCLETEATDEDVNNCFTRFRDVAASCKLPISVPTLEEWQVYQRTMAYHNPSGTIQATSLFWVALRFFLIEGMTSNVRASAEEALADWIERRSARVTSEYVKDILKYVACLSSMRLVAPLWSVMRPVFGGRFSTELSDNLRQMEGIVLWGDAPVGLDENTLRFSHPALAFEFLRMHGLRSTEDRVDALRPVLANLSPGSASDIWLAESLASLVLVPKKEERRTAEWRWRLDAFDALPPAIRNQNKTILHHWARSLYQSADRNITPPLSAAERSNRLKCAIEKLELALRLERRPGRDELPSHLYNTLGVAHAHYADLLENEGQQGAANEQWDAAWQSFRNSIDRDPSNMEALLAFSIRLIRHVRETINEEPKSALDDITHALELLDEAQDVIDHHSNPEPSWDQDVAVARAECLGLVDSAGGLKYAIELQHGDDPAIGYVCEARLALRNSSDQEMVRHAAEILDGAGENGVDLGERGLALRLMLARASDNERFNFELQLKLHEALEKAQRQSYRPLDKFRHAVLCYQAGRFADGKERFRKLREQFRMRSAEQPRVKGSFLSDKLNPNQPRIASVRVTRVNSPWDGDGFVDAIHQEIPLRPRHFSPPAKLYDVLPCVIRFVFTGPFAYPVRMAGSL